MVWPANLQGFGAFSNVHFKFPLLAAAAGPSPLAAASKQRCVTMINRRGDWPKCNVSKVKGKAFVLPEII